MTRISMKGRELNKDEIKSYKEFRNVSNIAYTKGTTVNKPTMQVGYNENGTIKEVEIRPFIYELNGSADIKELKEVKGLNDL
jgi:hypothetical protein